MSVAEIGRVTHPRLEPQTLVTKLQYHPPATSSPPSSLPLVSLLVTCSPNRMTEEERRGCEKEAAGVQRAVCSTRAPPGVEVEEKADGGSIQNRRFLSGYSRADYVRIRIGMSKSFCVHRGSYIQRWLICTHKRIGHIFWR